MNKAITVDMDDVEEVHTFQLNVKCPYCGYRECIEEDGRLPDRHDCFRCDQQFNIVYIKK